MQQDYPCSFCNGIRSQKTQSISHSYSSRVANRFSHNTLAKTYSKNLSCRKRYTLNATRDKQTRKKGAITPVPPTPTGFYVGVLHVCCMKNPRLFLVPKKGGLFRPGHLNKFMANEHFQMENLTCIKHLLNINEYMVKLDLTDAYLTVGVPESSRITEVPSVRLARPNLSASSLTAWAKHGTTNIYEATKGCGSLSSHAHSKYQTSGLPGRHPNHRVVSGNTKEAPISGNRSTAKPRLYNQFREVSVDPFSSTRVPRFLDKLENNEILVFDLCKSLLKENPISLHLLSQLQEFLESCRPAVWLASCTSGNGVVSGHCPSRLPSSRGTPVVDHQHQTGEWEPNSPPATEMVITSDASKMGWGATYGKLSTNGR